MSLICPLAVCGATSDISQMVATTHNPQAAEIKRVPAFSSLAADGKCGVSGGRECGGRTQLRKGVNRERRQQCQLFMFLRLAVDSVGIV